MNLKDQIAQLRFQLTLKHAQPHTVPRLELAYHLLVSARELWKMAGMQAHAIALEAHAQVVLRALDQPLE